MPAPTALRPAKAFLERLRPPEVHSEACLNCGTPLTGAFCSHCGQRDIPPYPSFRELVVDAFWELSGWDGRFASTVRALVRSPGLLTLEFLEGRRARYLSPLRLYLMASLVYFLIAPFSNAANKSSTVDIPGIKISATTDSTDPKPGSRAQRVAQSAQRAIEEQRAISPDQRDSLLKDIARAPQLLQPLLRRATLDPTGFKRAIFEAMPRVLFMLVPMFAAILSLFYRHRKYPEHLYFAIHLHAFIFVALSFSALAKLTHITMLISVVKFIALISIPIYLTLAIRKVYGGSMPATIVKETVIGTLYALTGGFVFIVAIFAVATWG